MIPNPPFSLAGLAEDRKMAPAMADRWRTCLTQEIDANLQAGWLLRLKHPLPGALPGRRYAIFHGIGMSSQRRLLTSYYENSDELRAQDVFALSPWIVLGLRNGISGTLIDVTRPRTWYPIGFLLDVPLECIFTTSKTDAYVPMEATPYDQQAFRRRFLGQNPLTMEQRTALRERIHQYILDHDMDPQDLGDQIEATNELEAPFREEQGFKPAFGPKSRKDILDPATLLGDPYDIDRAVFNEVGFFSRISDPERSVRITAVVITSSGKYATAVDWPDAHPDNNNYETQARQLAKRLGLPFYDLRLIPGM